VSIANFVNGERGPPLIPKMEQQSPPSTPGSLPGLPAGRPALKRTTTFNTNLSSSIVPPPSPSASSASSYYWRSPRCVRTCKHTTCRHARTHARTCKHMQARTHMQACKHARTHAHAPDLSSSWGHAHGGTLASTPSFTHTSILAPKAAHKRGVACAIEAAAAGCRASNALGALRCSLRAAPPTHPSTPLHTATQLQVNTPPLPGHRHRAAQEDIP